MKSWKIPVVALALFGFLFGFQSVVKAAPVKVKSLYKIVKTKAALKKGKAGKVGFKIVLNKNATKVHPQAPFKCKVSASKGIALKKNLLGHDDKKISKDKKKVDVAIGVVAKNAGKVTMNCSFFVCTKDICARTEEKIKIATKVK